MPLTTVDKARVKQAGNAVIAFGPKFTTLTAPSLATLTQDLTCVVLSFAADTDVSYTETQDLCDADARTELDRRVRTLGPIRIRVNSTNITALKALLAEDAEVGVVVRRFTSATTALAAADKVDAYNAKVAKFEHNEIAVGNEFEATVEFYGVYRERDVALVA